MLQKFLIYLHSFLQYDGWKMDTRSENDGQSHAKCYLVSKAHKTEFLLVCLCFWGSPFLMAVTFMSLGDAITPQIYMATEKRKRKQQLELHSG